jgi:hypothetical protein
MGQLTGGVLGIGMKLFGPIRTFVSKMIQEGHIFGEAINPCYNKFIEYLRRSAKAHVAPMKKTASLAGRNLKPDKYLSYGDMFDIPQKDMGKRFLYNIDESGFCAIANDVGENTQKAFQTSHTLLGSTSKSAGEVIIDQNAVILNSTTGHGAIGCRFF